MKTEKFSKNPEILIVDDNPDDIQFFIDLLIEKKYKVNIATCGVDALGFLESEIPDLIVLDVVMPGMTGIEVCKIIRSNEALDDVPIIFSTAENDSANIVDGFEAGGQDYVTKPLNAYEFLARIDTQLRLKFQTKSKIAENYGRLKVLYDIYQQTTQEYNIDSLVYETLYILKENLEVDVVGFYLTEEETGERKFYSDIGLTEEERHSKYYEKMECNIHNIAANDMEIGAIRICRRTGKAISESDQELLKAVCGQLGILIQNARLYTSLRNSEAKYKGLVENSDDIIFSIDSSWKITAFNKAFVKFVGLEEKFIQGKEISIISQSEKDKSIWSEKLKSLVEKKVGVYFDFRSESSRIEENHFHVSLIPVLDQRKEIVSIICSGHNVTDLIRNEETIAYLAYYDILTDMANRNRFFELCKGILSDFSYSEGHFAIMILGLDDFKKINDMIGQSAGDTILKEVSKRIKEVLSEETIVARIGGDEFAVLVKNYVDKDSVTQLCQSIMEQIRVPFLLDGVAQKLNSSAGIVFYPDGGKEYDELLKNADLALSQAKSDNKGNYKVYSREMRLELEEQMNFEKELDLAIINNEMYMVYQPQAYLKDHKIRGAEALLRWKHEKYGETPPTQFIPMLEKSGHIIAFGEWVLEKACKMAVELRGLGYPDFIMAVNVSPAQVMNKDFVDVMKRIIESTGVSPKCIEIEITESLFMGNVTDCVSTLERLKALGIGIVLDDFGTGYSSLTYINRLPINALKIDKSFVDNICADSKEKEIISELINLAHKLNLEVIAEGVEHENQKQQLQISGCDLLQGNLFSKPLDEKEIRNLLNNIKPLVKVKKGLFGKSYLSDD